MAYIIAEEEHNGPTALLTGWSDFENSTGRIESNGKGAILIFMPGAMEISRLARKLTGLIKKEIHSNFFISILMFSYTSMLVYCGLS